MLISKVPPVARIGAFRQISAVAGQAVEDEYGGPGLIQRLAELQNPSFERGTDRHRFDDINRSVATLFEDSDTTIEIPHTRNTILVHHQGQRLPLENLGTGFHEVIILAAAATVLSEHLVCIEEPEVHLHPTLQRRFLRYLSEHTDNQYLIATHSAHLLDAERASISSVRMEDGSTKLARAITPGEVALISAELGFRASDLVQANAVVWVEGPSDRVYIRHWIRQLDESLLEGVHYSLMFYGGSLLRYLAPDDPAVEEFVSLPRLNRNFAVVVDSDRSRKGAPLSGTKRQLRKKIKGSGAAGGVWVTKGYTIESYVPATVLRQAVSDVHVKTTSRWAGDLYTNPLSTSQLTGRTRVDKAAIARAAVKLWPVGAWQHDLKSQVRQLVWMIRRANDLPEA